MASSTDSSAASPRSRRTFLVTGASRGLGLGVVCLMAALGENVVAVARSSDRLGELERLLAGAPGRVSTQVADVTDERAVKAAFAQASAFGPIAGVLNNAGVLEPMVSIVRMEAKDFEQALRVNVLGVMLGIKQALLYHDGTSPLRVINVSSGAAVHAYEGWGAYCATKSAVNLLTEVAALETQNQEQVSIVSVAPGVIETSMQRLIRSTDEASFPAKDKFVGLHERGELLHPVDAAVALVWMLQSAPRQWSGRFVDVRDETIREQVDRVRAGDQMKQAIALAKEWFDRLER